MSASRRFLFFFALSKNGIENTAGTSPNLAIPNPISCRIPPSNDRLKPNTTAIPEMDVNTIPNTLLKRRSLSSLITEFKSITSSSII